MLLQATNSEPMKFTTGMAANLVDVTEEILSVSAPRQSALLYCSLTTDNGAENSVA